MNHHLLFRTTSGNGVGCFSEGFRKVDTDKWEFASEGFIRGQRHLLKNIQRRKSSQPQQIGSSSGSSGEAGKAALEGEIERLKKERSLMMREVIELQHQQRGTVQHMEIVNEKLHTAEKRQKQMVSFLGKILQNPSFLSRPQQNSITSPRTMRKFVKHQVNEPGMSDTKDVSFEVEGIARDEPVMVHAEAVATMGTIDSHHKENVVVGPQLQSMPEYFISFPEDLAKEKTAAEFSISGAESMTRVEDIWSVGFETGAGISSSTDELWSDVGNYFVPELGRFSDVWDIPLQADEDTPFNE